MTTAREELNESAELWGWAILPSPLQDELIYQRTENLYVFVQFDRAGVIRRAVRYQRDNRLLKVTGEIGWGVKNIASRVIGWFAADGERPRMHPCDCCRRIPDRTLVNENHKMSCPNGPRYREKARATVRR